ncbi:MAG: serine hydrolase [Chromatiales bacterium]|nr:MAG: serine hydrolase [Chromatiales bacterium]
MNLHRPWRRGVARGLAGALLILPLAAPGETPEVSLDERLAPLFSRWDQPGSPGAAVAVARGEQMLHAGGFGLASLEFRLPISARTPFNAGSIAKQFTATAILMLAAEGELSLDDRIRKYVPELPRIADRITLSQLLHHTSGLRDIWALTDLAGWMPADVRTQRQALRLLSRQRALNFEPGRSFGYSNSGYLLLAEVVARTSRQDFPAWTEEHLFAPLGMAETYFYEDHTGVLPNVASSYRSLGREKGFAREVLNSGLVGGGNLVTTVTDLARWARYLLAAEIGGKPLLARLTEQPTLAGGLQTGYGMGLFVESYRGLPVVHHGGASAGFRSHLLVFVDEPLSIVILGNVNSVRANPLARRVADAVLAERFTGSRFAAPPEPIEPELPPHAYTGLYAIGPELLLDVREANGQLYFLFGGTTPREMRPSGPHTFNTSEEGVRLTFTADDDGTVNEVQLQVPGRTLRGQRLAPITLTAAQARAYEGKYFSDELETYYTIVRADDGLTARRLRGEDIGLKPIDADRFIEAVGGDLTVRFLRKRSGRIKGFEISVERARGIQFKKQ